MKKQLFFIAVLALLGLSATAQDVQFSNQLIQRYESAKIKAQQKDATMHDHLWLTPILQKALPNWNNLTNEAQQIFKK